MSLADLREEYRRGALGDADVDADPFAQFRAWFDDAVAAGVAEPNAMTLSTVGLDGYPSSRVVLLKALDARGFTFFTNYDSQKGRELAACPRASLTFLWLATQRQVTARGDVERVPEAESNEYFATRPRGSQLGAWASDQSRHVASRAALDARLAEAEARFPGEVPRPPHWGGFVLRPTRVELWQGRTNRMHDRLVYARDGERWALSRLCP
ncbi:MAG: pyridoxamine 5'-phosphate oxidase [Polyangiaceae bacterium]|nr:pyridoxamine 5'-phosphate oxidase [Polyangiaceae bacterium]